MIPAIRESRSSPVLFFLAVLFVFFIFAAPAFALSEVEVNPVNTPQGAVVLIVDGLSAPFIYPELTRMHLTARPLKKPNSKICRKLIKRVPGFWNSVPLRPLLKEDIQSLSREIRVQTVSL